MKPRHIVLLSLLISALLFTWVTWPLARYVHEGMPASHRPEPGGARAMIPGDHLQFLFQLWMLADVFEGKTPLFYHVYEFNQGNDEERRDVGSYYFPFGVLYAAGEAVAGRAGGWNLMLFVAAWLTYLLTWVLARRFCKSALTAAVAALPGLLLPYLWTCMLGGSPTGLGMMWVPLIFYGIDKAVRERSVRGGVVAGLALFMSPWTDLHVFFFAFLATPIWVVLCLLWAMEEGTWSRRWRDLLIPVTPLAMFMAAASIQIMTINHSISATAQSRGRTVGESLIFAPKWEGWIAWDPASRHNYVYLGWVVLAVLIAGLVLLLWDAFRKKGGGVKRLLVFCFFLAAIAGIALLALGPNVPYDPDHRVFQAMRKLIPPYKMVRQAAKVFCLLGPFMAVVLAIALDRIQALFARRTAAIGLMLAVAVAMTWDYGRRIEPAVCLLDHTQGAYRAIAEDAAQCGRENRAMAIPIWPGDSHWSSLTEYYSTLHRTKMLNGYRPGVREQYRIDIFEPFAPMNMGYIAEDRLDALLARKIGYLIVQENAFPDKVSPFPVAHTLDALLRHPRIEFLARDGEVWAFKILAAGEERKPAQAEQGTSRAWLAARRWWAPDFATPGAVVVTNDQGEATGVLLANPEDRVQLSPRFIYHVEGLRYVIAARGRGTLCGAFRVDSNSAPQVVTARVGPEWSWIELPVPEFPGAGDLILDLSAEGGPVEVGHVTVIAGPWPWLKPGEHLALPADAFFRAGYSDVQDGSVHLSAVRDPADVVFYASNVPLVEGRYRVSVDFSTAAGVGAEVGSVAMLRGKELLASCPMAAGQPASFEFRHDSQRLLRFELRFNRSADLTIRGVTLTRLE